MACLVLLSRFSTRVNRLRHIQGSPWKYLLYTRSFFLHQKERYFYSLSGDSNMDIAPELKAAFEVFEREKKDDVIEISQLGDCLRMTNLVITETFLEAQR